MGCRSEIYVIMRPIDNQILYLIKGADTLQIDVRFFALYREQAGQASMTVELPTPATVGLAVEELRRMLPHLAPKAPDIVTAVNAQYASDDTPLQDGDQLALIPPVSGGAPMIHITKAPIDPDAVTNNVRKETNGGTVTFLGTTRSHFEGRRVLYLEYEAYVDMAMEQIEGIIQDIRGKWTSIEMAVSHRIGRVDVGEVSLVVAAAAPHRKEAFLACQEFVDRLKQTVPIWKKEYFVDGSRWVVCDDHIGTEIAQISQESI